MKTPKENTDMDETKHEKPDSNQITQETLDRIRALAKEATPGPWEYREDNAAGYNIESQDDYIVYSGTDSDCECDYGCEKESNAAYIAALSPDVALALVDEVERLRAENARLEKESDWLANILADEGCLLIDVLCGGDCNPCDFPCRQERWREAARRAVEEQSEQSKHDLFDYLAKHPDTKLAPEEK